MKIESLNRECMEKCKQHWDSIAKPLDSMGEFEDISVKIARIQGRVHPDISRRAVLVLCSDNGIVVEGVSQSGQDITRSVTELLGKGESSVCQLGKAANVDIIPVDIGVNTDMPIPDVLNRKIRRGTRNFRIEPAMTEAEALAAISVGIELARESKEKGYKILALGEMGIGNTTTSAAVAAALLRLPPEAVCGRGAGLSDTGLQKKQRIIREAIEKYGLYQKNALEILRSVGGLDIAGLTGICIGGALYHIPVVLDGLISAVSGLLAERLLPGVRDYLLSSHLGKEPAMQAILKELRLQPVIHGRLALGEGSGAVLLFPLLDTAFSLYENAVSFQEAEIESYRRF